MDIEQLREYCIKKSDVLECFPFDDDTLVFKVATRGGKEKIFALVSLAKHYVMLKCDPDRAVELRERYADIEPAYHMNKRHWNGISMCGSIPDGLLCEMIDHSYCLVLGNPPK